MGKDVHTDKNDLKDIAEDTLPGLKGDRQAADPGKSAAASDKPAADPGKQAADPAAKNRKQSARPSRREVLMRMLSRFHFGWILACSLAFVGILFLALQGIDMIASNLISSSGHVALTSGDYGFFFRSWQGYVTIIVVVISLLFVVSIIVNGIILLSDTLFHGRPVYIIRIMRRSVTSIRLFLCRQALPIVLYFALFILYFTITILSFVPNPFEIPGYLRYVLNKQFLTRILYFAGLIAISYPLIRNPLILHDMLLGQDRPKEARDRTRVYVDTHRRLIAKEILIPGLIICASMAAAVIIFLYLPMLVQTVFGALPLPIPVLRIAVLTTTYLGLVILILAALSSPWILTMAITRIYDQMLENEQARSGGSSGYAGSSDSAGSAGSPVSKKTPSRILHFLIPLFAALFVAAIVLSYIHFNYLFPPAKNIEAVVHRLGGDMDVENTLEGMEIAIEMGAPAAETDIQRTKDGEYVIFHDSTLKRMCGLPTKISEMTLEEVENVRIPGLVWGEERRIPLLSEVLDMAKGRIKLYLELKGSTADEKMVWDVMKMVRERDMLEECVLISMNYSLIRYINETIPDIPCGYLYFFAYGMESKLSGNLLMAQSNAINSTRTRSIHSQGKKVYCWTVNSMQTAQNMVRQRVDGIITDRYDIVDSVLSHMESRNDYERIMDVLLS